MLSAINRKKSFIWNQYYHYNKKFIHSKQQTDLGEERRVTDIRTMGHGPGWVTRYNISVSSDGVFFRPV